MRSCAFESAFAVLNRYLPHLSDLPKYKIICLRCGKLYLCVRILLAAQAANRIDGGVFVQAPGGMCLSGTPALERRVRYKVKHNCKLAQDLLYSGGHSSERTLGK